MKDWEVAIRTDSSVRIGVGHVMRTLALADLLAAEGARIFYISRKLPGDFSKYVEAKGYPVYRLPDPMATNKGAVANGGEPVEWSDASWKEDAEQSLDVLAKRARRPDWLIVDHYGLGHEWESHMRSAAKKIMVIDDLADRDHDCDLLVDQNFHDDMAHRYDNLVQPSCVKLIGPSFALLRPEFGKARNGLRARKGEIRRILVFFGGSDPTNETTKVLRAVELLDRQDIAVDVVVGAPNPNRHEVEKKCRSLPSVAFHCQVENMAELMAEANLAVGAGGSAAWERCCLGLPSMVIAVAENQVGPTQSLARLGVVRFLGRSGDVSAEILVQALQHLISDTAGVAAMAKATLSLVDGCGAERVATTLRKLHCDAKEMPSITFHYAQPHDENRLFEWRNAPEVRSSSFDNRLISAEEHSRWFCSVMNNPDRHLLIGEAEGKPIGVLRYDVTATEAEVSIYLLPGLSGRGLGTALLQQGTVWVSRNLPSVTAVKARILETNLASQKVFAKAGFVARGQDYILILDPKTYVG